MTLVWVAVLLGGFLWLFGGTLYNLWLLLRPADTSKFATRYGGGTAVVTGGSNGIGLALCRRLALRNIDFIVIAKGQDEVATAKASLGPHCIAAIAADLADYSEHSSVIAAVENALGERPLSLLFNNVGVSNSVPAELGDMPLEEVETILAVNAVFTTRLTRALVPRLVAAARRSREKRAGLVTLSSMAGLLPAPWASVYGATKALNVGLSRALRTELRSDKVDVVAVAPGMVACGNTTAWFEPARLRLSDVATPDEVAAGILKLVQPSRLLWPSPPVLLPTVWHTLHAAFLVNVLPPTWAGEMVLHVHRAAAHRIAASSDTRR